MHHGRRVAACPKAISCNCHTGWEARRQCDHGQANFAPVHGRCERSRGRKEVNAVCEVVPCGSGAGEKCKSCEHFSKRQAVNHCASCNEGHYLLGTKCKAYGCGRACKTCVEQARRTAPRSGRVYRLALLRKMIIAAAAMRGSTWRRAAARPLSRDFQRF